jgi:hypothetical protein
VLVGVELVALVLLARLAQRIQVAEVVVVHIVIFLVEMAVQVSSSFVTPHLTN